MRIKRCLDFIVVDFGLFMGKFKAYLRDYKIKVEDLVIIFCNPLGFWIFGFAEYMLAYPTEPWLLTKCNPLQLSRQIIVRLIDYSRLFCIFACHLHCHQSHNNCKVMECIRVTKDNLEKEHISAPSPTKLMSKFNAHHHLCRLLRWRVCHQ